MDFELHMLADIDTQFYAHGISSMNSSSKLWLGRPFGELAILWRKMIGNQCNIVKFDSESRLLGITVGMSGKEVLIVNVYLPCDSAANEDDYMFYLGKINNVITSHTTPYAIIMGDFNADVCCQKAKRFGKILLNFCQEESLVMSDYVALKDYDSYTFFSEAHNSVSWLDHVLSTHTVNGFLDNLCILNSFVTSDHFPLSVTLRVNSIVPVKVETTGKGTSVQWPELSEDEIQQYTTGTAELLDDLQFDCESLTCTDIGCECLEHCLSIDVMYDGLIGALNSAAVHFVKPKKRFKQVPGWNDYCRETHAAAREAFLLWQVNGKLRQGQLFDTMKRT
jgi:hypothetical protein